MYDKHYRQEPRFKMRNKFFKRNNVSLRIEWNSAHPLDWPKLRRNFVGSYFAAYLAPCNKEPEIFNSPLRETAEKIWNEAYEQGFTTLLHEVIQPLQFYLLYQNKPLESEINELIEHFPQKMTDIHLTKEHLIKLIILKNYFETHFDEEKLKIADDKKKINYLILRFNEQPIAFFTCEFNYKSGRIYLRFINISPTFHRLGLGQIILEEISKHYPEAIGLELYARKDNYSAIGFYKRCGFQKYRQFDFKEPFFKGLQVSGLHFPNDDGTDNVDEFIAFAKSKDRSTLKFC